MKLVAPFATDLAEMMRNELGYDDDVHYSSRPIADESKMVEELINLPIQINGKMRGNVELAPWTSEEDALAAAKAVENIVKYLEEGTVRKVIYVQDKIINIIVG